MNKTVSALAILFMPIGLLMAAAPVVSNVTASQRSGTKLVDIYYSVSDVDGDAQNIQVQVSADGGLTYTIPCITLSGHVGAGIAPGTGKHIVWDAGADWDGQFVATTKVRVTAYDGSTPVPPPGMAYIPAGPFQMGDSFNEGSTDQLPLHNVQVDAFFMDRFEVSKELWQSVQTWGAANGYNISGGSFAANGHPVNLINWYDVAKWCNARSEKEGHTPCYYTDTAQTLVYRTGNVDITSEMVKWNASGYRLPTEAEWEKAARGGIQSQRYPWGNTITGSQANYSGSGDPFNTNNPQTTPIGYFNGNQVPAGVDMANGYGLYDMVGNVLEWCWDWYGNTYYGVSQNTNPRGPILGTHRVLRGGAWNTQVSELRCANRGYNTPSFTSYYGFRCARGL